VEFIKMHSGTELYVVVGQFGTVMTEPGPEKKAKSAKAVMEATNYGPYTVKQVHEVADNLVHSTLPKNLLAKFRRQSPA
jgi:hypothetical protein|tara:strand:+ start:291 stop:527 length:237 start_codon:yes stop_codon:yes gene_type:complete